MDTNSDLDSVIGAAISGESLPDKEPEINDNEPVAVITEKETPDQTDEKEAVAEAVAALYAPDKWSGFSKTKFNMLPKEVQKELVDYHKSVESQQKVYNALDETIGENKAAVVASYGSVENMFKHYMQLDQFAAKDPAGLVKWFCQQRGIDPSILSGQQSAPAAQDVQQAAPDAAMQRIAAIERSIEAQAQSQSHAVISQAAAKIAEFEKNPDYPFFNDVRTTMGDLIQSGKAKDLPDAYKKAIRLHDDIYEQTLEQETRKRLESQTNQAQKAKNAASIKPTAGSSGKSRMNGAADIDAIINDAMSVRV